MRIQCQTLFDITATGVTGHIKPSRMPFTDQAGQRIIDAETWNRSRNQQRNWETITQLISLRTQIDNLTLPTGINNQWQFEFDVGIEDLFTSDSDSLGILKGDCSGVPMLLGLGESSNIDSILLVNSNIWFKIIPINN